MGTPEFAVPALEGLVSGGTISPPSIPNGPCRGARRVLEEPPVKKTGLETRSAGLATGQSEIAGTQHNWRI